MTNKRSLYQCLNAKVLDSKIYCSKGYEIPVVSADIRALKAGRPLEVTVCQSCENYDGMGDPVSKEDRGWD